MPRVHLVPLQHCFDVEGAQFFTFRFWFDFYLDTWAPADSLQNVKQLEDFYTPEESLNEATVQFMLGSVSFMDLAMP